MDEMVWTRNAKKKEWRIKYARQMCVGNHTHFLSIAVDLIGHVDQIGDEKKSKLSEPVSMYEKSYECRGGAWDFYGQKQGTPCYFCQPRSEKGVSVCM